MARISYRRAGSTISCHGLIRHYMKISGRGEQDEVCAETVIT
jgi:hypothetical protein